MSAERDALVAMVDHAIRLTADYADALVNAHADRRKAEAALAAFDAAHPKEEGK